VGVGVAVDVADGVGVQVIVGVAVGGNGSLPPQLTQRQATNKPREQRTILDRATPVIINQWRSSVNLAWDGGPCYTRHRTETHALPEGVFLCPLAMRTIEYDPTIPAIKMIDQRLLPGKLEFLILRDSAGVIHAIKDMAVRGAPAIGITAAFGMALVGHLSSATTYTVWEQDLRDAALRLIQARPTAINLRWAVEKILDTLCTVPDEELKDARSKLDELAQKMADDDVEINTRMAQFGAELLPDASTVIHHCNTGALAAVDYGTALGVIRYAHEIGKKVHVLVDETRPRLQGARLTAWELGRYGISYEIISDNAAGYFLQRSEVDAVLVGADRIAANGDVANKIGTYMLALAADACSIPFYCVAPRSTFDRQVAQGTDIPIEERSPAEVLSIRINHDKVVPAGATARNPAFDITPHDLVTAFVTEYGLIHPPYPANIQTMIEKSEA
jgi:methylthioribose-1-phosphate isomerase